MGKQTSEFFNYVGVDAHGRKQYKLKPMDQYATEHRTKEQPSKQYFKQTKLTDIIMEYPFTKKNAKQSDIDKGASILKTAADPAEMGQRRAFINFVEGLLHLDPIKRWTPLQASKHPFITGEKYTAPYEVSNSDQSLLTLAPICADQARHNRVVDRDLNTDNILQKVRRPCSVACGNTHAACLL
jgi:dual specificity protein kinase YAK1